MRTSKIIVEISGAIKLVRYENGEEFKTIYFDSYREALVDQQIWNNGSDIYHIPHFCEEGLIDSAATAGYAAGLNGITIPPFDFAEFEHLSWCIGNRKGLEDRKQKRNPLGSFFV